MARILPQTYFYTQNTILFQRKKVRKKKKNAFLIQCALNEYHWSILLHIINLYGYIHSYTQALFSLLFHRYSAHICVSYALERHSKKKKIEWNAEVMLKLKRLFNSMYLWKYSYVYVNRYSQHWCFIRIIYANIRF